MTYTQLLNTALELLDEQGPQQAFDFMQQQSPNVEYANPAQLYNFSYCLAAMCDRTDDAMDCSRRRSTPTATGRLHLPDGGRRPGAAAQYAGI